MEEIGVLGSLVLVDQTGIVHPVVQRNVRAFLACLVLCHPDEATLTRLGDTIWHHDDWTPGAMRTAATRARAELKMRGIKSEIVFSEHGYRLGRVASDVDRFVEELNHLETVTDPALRVELAFNALALWRGEPFAELGEHSFVAAERRRLHELRWRCDSLLADALVAVDRTHDALAILSSAIDREPPRETAVEQAMRINVNHGQETEAIRLFRMHCARLAALGIDVPGAVIGDLARQIGDPANRPTPSVGASKLVRALRSDPRSIPTAATSFVGRGSAVEHVSALLDERRLLTIVGPGGIGKTRLTAEIAKQRRERVIWIDLTLYSSEELIEALATAFDLSISEPAVMIERLVDELRAEPSVVILDNCEHVLDDAAELAESIVQHCTTALVLCTSRSALRSISEAVYELDPLSPSETAELFADRLGTSGLRHRSGLDLETLTELSGGLPLAIELTAASPRLHGSGPESLRRGNERHRTIVATVEASLKQLDFTEANFFESIGVLAGSFDARDASAVSGVSLNDAQHMLARLHSVSLITVDTGSALDGRPAQNDGYRLLEPLRRAALARLDERPDAPAVLDRHRSHLETVVIESSTLLEQRGEADAVARLERLDPQLRGLWERSAQYGVASAVKTAAALQNYSFLRLNDSHVAWTRRLINAPGATDCDGYDDLIGGASMAAWARSDRERAERYARRSLDWSVASGKRPSLFALSTLQNVAGAGGDIQETLQRFHEVATWAKETDNPYWMSLTAVTETLAGALLGDRKNAFGAALRALRLAESSDNPSMLAWALYGQGYARLSILEHDQAIDVFKECVDGAASVRNRWVQGMGMAGLATALRRAGRVGESGQLLVELVGHWHRGSMYGQLGATLAEVALVANTLELPKLAQKALRARSAVSIPHPLLPTEGIELSAVKKQLQFPVGKFMGDTAELFRELIADLSVLL